MNRAVSAVFVTLLLIASITAIAVTGSAQTDIAIQSVNVSSEQPAAGESFTLRVNVANVQTNDSAVGLQEVYVRETGSFGDEFARVEDNQRIGAIAPGQSLEIPLEMNIDEPGDYDLTVYAVVENDDGDRRRVSYPVDITIEEPVIEGNISATFQSQNGSDTIITDVTNFGNADFTNVEVRASQNGEVVSRKLIGDVDRQSSQSVEFDADTFTEGTVTFTAVYETLDESYTETTSLDTTEHRDIDGEIRLTSIEISRSGGRITIQGEAANIGGTGAESVLLSVQESNSVRPVAPSGEYFIGTVDASEFATFELTAEAQPEISSMPIELTYIVDGERMTTMQQLDIESANSSEPDGNTQVTADGSDETNGSSGLLGSIPLTLIVIVVAVVAVGFGVYRWRQ